MGGKGEEAVVRGGVRGRRREAERKIIFAMSWKRCRPLALGPPSTPKERLFLSFAP